MSIAVFLLLWSSFAVFSGRMEGKFMLEVDHRAMTVVRALALVVLAAFSGVPFAASTMLLVPLAMAVFASAHRASFNLTRGQGVTYMGPRTRSRNSSWYDELWWMITAKSVAHTDLGHVRHYTVAKEYHPWLAATAFEVCTAICSVIAHNAAQP